MTSLNNYCYSSNFYDSTVYLYYMPSYLWPWTLALVSQWFDGYYPTRMHKG